MSIENSQSYITNELLVLDRSPEGNSQEETKTFFNKQTGKNNFYYREMVRTRSSRPYFFSKCHLHHRGEELFAFFFYSTSTISLL